MNYLCIYDLETTGAQPQVDDFVQLASVLYPEGRPEQAVVFNSLALPRIPIGAGAQEVHGISPEKVATCRPTREVALDWLQKVKRHVGDDSITFVGHNCIGFDQVILAQHLEEDWPPQHTIDTLQLARRVDPLAVNHKLGTLAEAYGLGDQRLRNNAHEALADCWLVALLLQHYLEQCEVSLADMRDWLAQPIRLKCIPFGKFKGKSFYNLHNSALKWFLKDGMDPDCQYSAKVVLDERASRWR